MPEWCLNLNGVYPSSEYIAQIGKSYGKQNSKEAITNAVQQIASYLRTEVSARIETNYINRQVKDSKSNKIDETEINENIRNITLESNIQLLALQYTDPYYDKKSKTWFACAYIKKSEAFEKLKPKIEDSKEKFYGFYKVAESENEPILKIRDLNASKKSSEEFLVQLEFASLFADTLVENEYRKDRTIISEISSVVNEIRTNCPLYLSIANDTDNIVYGAITDVFQNLGWIVTSNKSVAKYNINAQINFNSNNEYEDDGYVLYVYFPDLKMTINDTNGSLYTFTAKTDKVLDYDKKKIQAKACKNIASAVEQRLPSEFSAFISGKE